MSRRTRRGWISMAVVALVAAAGAFTGPVLRTDAPTRLRADIVIPARPTSLQLDAPIPPLAGIVIPARPTALQLDVVTLRQTYRLPSLEICVIRADSVVDVSVGGVRKARGTDAVTSRDLFHLGSMTKAMTCLLYTSDAADDLLCVDLGGRRIIKK